MNIADPFDDALPHSLLWISFKEDSFFVQKKRPKNFCQNRETLAHLYEVSIDAVEKKGLDRESANRYVRSLWIEQTPMVRDKNLPRVISDDGFLRMYALGAPLSLDLMRSIWRRTEEPLQDKIIELNPITIGWNLADSCEKNYHDVGGTPPGCLAKFIPFFRLKKDKELLLQIAHDLALISDIENEVFRKELTLAVLAQGAAYRELAGETLKIPSFSTRGKLVEYTCEQHLIGEGLKTISLFPSDPKEAGIYVCQGTELWPSQPAVLGSILANFAPYGSATEAYAHSWRRIHKHLRDLNKPYVTGHSMGGSLAMQIGLYSHELIEESYAFNAPMPHERDYAFYHHMSVTSKIKIHSFANLDDFAFWRIGSKVIGDVRIFMGRERYPYLPVGLWDCVYIIPAFVKCIINLRNAAPSHQKNLALTHHWISVKLTEEEIGKENIDRIHRFDYLSFLPRLYDPMKSFLQFFRSIIKWRLEKQYLHNEMEILALHEHDLIDTLTEMNKMEIANDLEEIRRQKKILQARLDGKKREKKRQQL